MKHIIVRMDIELENDADLDVERLHNLLPEIDGEDTLQGHRVRLWSASISVDGAGLVCVDGGTEYQEG